MRYGSVCSGVEAATLAWEPLGWEPVFFAEVEPFPCAVLMQKFNATKPQRLLDPNEADTEKERKQRELWQKKIATFRDGGTIPNFGDFTKIEKDDYDGEIDLLVGGTSCQSFSVAGLRKGLEDARGNLALEFARLAYRTGVRWLVWENVPGVLSSNQGKDFAAFLSLLCGWEVEVPVVGKRKGEPERKWRNSGIVTGAPGCYSLAWRTLDAQFVRVDGYPRAVPQRRRRIFLVGYLGNWQYPAAVLFDPGCLSRDNPPQRKTGAGVARSLTASSGGASGKEQQYTFVNEYGIPLNALSAKPLEAADGDITRMENPNLVCMAHGQGGAEVMSDHAPTLSCNHEAPIVCRESGQGFWQQDEASGTVKVNGAEPTTVVCYDARGLGSGDVSPVITGDHAARTNDYMPVIVENKASFGFLPGQGSKAGSVGFEEELSPTLRSSCDSYGVLCYGIAENIINRKPQNGGNGTGISRDVQFTLNTSGVHGVCCFTQNDAGRDCTYELAPTLRSGGSDGGPINQAIADSGTVRRLTPTEAERLMGFPDGHTQIEWSGKAKEYCPDGARYKACGNSMCVNVMRWIGTRIQLTEAFLSENIKNNCIKE